MNPADQKGRRGTHAAVDASGNRQRRQDPGHSLRHADARLRDAVRAPGRDRVQGNHGDARDQPAALRSTEQYIKREFETLESRLKAEREERSDAGSQHSRELKDLGDNLTRRLRELG